MISVKILFSAFIVALLLQFGKGLEDSDALQSRALEDLNLDFFFEATTAANDTFELIEGVEDEGSKVTTIIGDLTEAINGALAIILKTFSRNLLLSIVFSRSRLVGKSIEDSDGNVNIIATCSDGEVLTNSGDASVFFSCTSETANIVSLTAIVNGDITFLGITHFNGITASVPIGSDADDGEVTIANIDVDCYGNLDNLAVCGLEISEEGTPVSQTHVNATDKEPVTFHFLIEDEAIITATATSYDETTPGVYLNVLASGNTWSSVGIEDTSVVVKATGGTLVGPFNITVTVTAINSPFSDITVEVMPVTIIDLLIPANTTDLEEGILAEGSCNEDVTLTLFPGQVGWLKVECVTSAAGTATVAFENAFVITEGNSTDFCFNIGRPTITRTDIVPDDPVSTTCNLDYATKIVAQRFSSLAPDETLLYTWFFFDNTAFTSATVTVKSSFLYASGEDFSADAVFSFNGMITIT